MLASPIAALRVLAALLGLLVLPLWVAPAAMASTTSTYTNPVYRSTAPDDFPDPSVLRVGDTYYAYATNGAVNVRTVRSTDLANWSPLGDALPELPRWAQAGYTWAPSVLQRGERYVLYYTLRHRASGLQCVSRATANAPAGPFVDGSSGPFLCQADRGGSIDPEPFVDHDGTPFLIWKSEGVMNREAPRIWVQQLSGDGLHLVGGGPTLLLRQDQGWEFPIIEGPAMLREAGRYYLFYAGNRWESPGYAISYAVCASVRGPCAKPRHDPWFTSSWGPGSPAFFRDSHGAPWMAHHAWTGGRAGYPAGSRDLYLERIAFSDGAPLMSGPSSGPTPLRRAHRLAGSDRFTTATALSAAAYPHGAPVVYLASGRDYPDALAAGPAAAGRGPVLLTARDRIPAATRAELDRLRAEEVVVLGGPAPVSQTVVDALMQHTGGRVRRLAGKDRYATAAAVAADRFPAGIPVVYLASGERHPDALAASAAGAATGGPVLLTTAAALPTATAAELDRLQPGRIVVAGGTAAVSEAVERGLRERFEATVTRVAGRDRSETAALLVREVFSTPVPDVYVATGSDFPDALAAATLAAPVLLVPPSGLPEPVGSAIRRLAPERVVVLGGPRAVSARTFALLDLL